MSLHVIPTDDPNVLVDRQLQLHPSPEDVAGAASKDGSAEIDDEDEAATERAPLLGHGQGRRRTDRSRSASVRRQKAWYRRPHPLWLFPAVLLSGLFMGGKVGVELEILQQMACRAVDLKMNVVLPVVDEEWAARCRKSPAVAKKQTEILTAMSMISGILGSATTGSWGALSDRIGRKVVLGVTTVSFVASLGASILVATFPESFGLTGFYTLTAISGALGGPLAFNALVTAYISDATPAGSRANIFSIRDGLGFAGMALGPLTGSLLIRVTGITLVVHFADLTFRILLLCALLFAIPESLSRSRRRDEKIRRALQDEASRIENAASDARRGLAHRLGLSIWRKVTEIFEPLALLLPQPTKDVEDEEHRPRLPRTDLRVGQLDWNLTNVALCIGALWVVPGLSVVKILYAKWKFDWNIDQVSAYITLISVSKLLFLLGILPLVLQRLRKPAPTPSRPRPSSTAVGATSRPEVLSDEQHKWDAESTHMRLVYDSRFDLKLARWSILVAIFAYGVCAIPSESSTIFLFGNIIISCAGGALPALQSLALALSSPRDSGRLLASLSVLSSLAVEVIGPPFFGSVYIMSISWFPELVFVTAACWFVCALVPAFWIKLPKGGKGEEEELI